MSLHWQQLKMILCGIEISERKKKIFQVGALESDDCFRI